MLNSRDRLSHRTDTRHRSKPRSRRRAFRRLLAETLERRMLLTTVVGVTPMANSNNAPISTDVSATFDQNVNAGTVTSDTFVVHGSRTGHLTGGATTVSAAGPVVTHNPTGNFAPGERVRVTVTSDITTTGGAANPRVWQFFTEVTSGSGQFVDSGQVFNSGNVGEQAGFGDVDGDGDLDVLEGEDFVWLNDGNGVFTDSGQRLGLDCTDSCGQGGGIEPRFADVDNDGDLDAVGTSSISLNNGSGIFIDNGQDFSGGSTISVGDLDADGDVDLMQGLAYGPARVWFNNGNGQFTNSGQALGTASFGFEFGDFDNDGDLDAFAANNGPADAVWLNDGSGVFTNSGQVVGGARSNREVDVGDIDGDGDLDVVVSGEYGAGTQIWVNDGSGVFTESVPSLGPGDRGRTVQLGDLDADGDLDMIVANLDNPGTGVWLNDGSGSFTAGQHLSFSADNIQRRVEGGSLGDADGDGDLDFWEAGLGAGGSRLWINQNLQPSVSLSVDNTSIDEAAGSATVTATLSAVHTQPVTVDLGFSGTATETDDYTASGAQIVIAAGATTGSVTITAVEDPNDEPDETVIIDIASVDGADEAGIQQVTTTILDNDEPVPVPDVTLEVDNIAIPEAGGVATFTANLSVATTVAVTIDLGISGSAAATDFNASGTQIVVAPGATSGSISVSAVQDTEDESDETVIVDITNVAGGNELGTQQQTTTITDDDEPVVPEVTLAVDNADIAEAGGVATFTATLSEATTVDVTVDLELTGTATVGDDYNASGTQIAIAAGETSGSVTVSAVQDEQDEPDETVVVDIASVTNGTESGTQQVTTTIADDDEPTGFAVTELTPTSTGFQVAFTNDIDVADLSLYDTQTAGLGPADVVLTGTASGPVSGSLVVAASGRMVEFIKTGDALAPDNYTVTLRSATDGFEDTGGLLLDGNGDGTAGDDYSSAFAVAEPAAGTVTVGIPDIVRGPGQEVNLPADATTGIPLTISEGTNIRAIDARISYDPTLLNITAATLGPDAPAGASVILNNSTPGLAIVVYFATAPLPAGAGTFVNLQASVPTESASENYRRQQVLDVHSVIVSDGNDNESPVIENDALQVATFFADVSANGRINAADAAQVARIAALLDGGFLGTPSTDPGLVGDISGNGRLNAADASLVAQFAALLPVSQIPGIPGGVVIAGLAAADLGQGLPGATTSSPRLADHSSSLQVDDSSDSSEGSADLAAASDIRYPAVDRALTELGSSGGLGDTEDLALTLEEAVEELLASASLDD